MGYGEKIIGHAGANIGTSAYMVHSPDHHFSVVVMINGFNHDCSKEITGKIIGNILRELNAIGIIPYLYYTFYPYDLIIVIAIAIWTIVIVFHIRKKRVATTR
jgi:hypothetical protein